MVLAIKCTMIVQGAIYLTDHAAEADTRTGLRANRLVWEKAVSLFKNLSSQLISNAPDLVKLKSEYDEFLVLLQVSCILYIATGDNAYAGSPSISWLRYPQSIWKSGGPSGRSNDPSILVHWYSQRSVASWWIISAKETRNLPICRLWRSQSYRS